MISEEQIDQLCRYSESNCVDYKRDQYSFICATDNEKAELLKDVLCFAKGGTYARRNYFCESTESIVQAQFEF